MTKVETTHMDAKFKEQGLLITNLSSKVTDVGTKVAVLEDRQKDQPTINRMWGIIGGLVTLLLGSLALIATLMAAAGKITP